MDAGATKLFDLIDAAYASALNPEKWTEFLEQISGHFKDASTVLWHTDRSDIRCNVFEFIPLRAFFIASAPRSLLHRQPLGAAEAHHSDRPSAPDGDLVSRG